MLGASLRGGCDSVTAAAPALPERSTHGNKRAGKHHTQVTHLSSSFAALNEPSLSLTTTGREPGCWPETIYNAQHEEAPRSAPVVSLISANTNFHRRGLATETVGDAYLTQRQTHYSKGERGREGGWGGDRARLRRLQCDGKGRHGRKSTVRKQRRRLLSDLGLRRCPPHIVKRVYFVS
jgi:hypothetical protein